ncbi:MAG: excinuclease ABC subunit UvrA [Planctomycetota bacterium]
MPAASKRKTTKKRTSKRSKKATDTPHAGVEAKPNGVATNANLAEHDFEKTGERRFDPIREIRVRGAREHNLKSLDVDIPRDRLVVVTGLSGSGKSSLAFDTIFAEGQRKYMESLSAYARQFLDQLKKPDVEQIEGLPPTIAIEQRSSGHNPRSTVATTTEIYDYLRLLFARCGEPRCWHPTKSKKGGEVIKRCGKPISAASASAITDAVSKFDEGTRIMVMAPLVRAKKGFHKDVAEKLVSDGFVRARVNGSIVDLREALKEDSENPLGLGRYEKHTIEAVIDRLVVKPDARQRLNESIETALRLGEGVAIVGVVIDKDSFEDHVYSEQYACAEHPEASLQELEPRIFSFNSPQGACKECDGLGTLMEFDESLVIPNPALSLADGAVAAWAKNGPVRAWFNRRLRRFCRDFEAKWRAPVSELDADQQRILLHGTTEQDEESWGATFEGVIPNVTEWWGTTDNEGVKEWLSGFMSQTPCPICHGDRLRIESLSVFLRTKKPIPAEVAKRRASVHALSDDPHDINISDFTRLNIVRALEVIESLDLTSEQLKIADAIVREVRARLGFLTSVGLDYLSLDRKTATLSGGEAQRIRLATQVGSGLVGACYVLDEPTIGLHQRDNRRLIDTLRHLADIGNTVIVVEHDEDMIRSADHVIDIGPGPGVHGGTVVAQGTIEQISTIEDSLTGAYLSGARAIEVPVKRRKLSPKKAITVKGARENNLKRADAAFPVGGIVCVTGVSGSGKSTLVNDILLQSVKRHLHGTRVKPGAHDRVNGLQHIDRVIEVDQSPIGRTPRSNPATYTNMFNDVRSVFAKTKEAKVRGYEIGRFSFNVKGGRCEACGGHGVKKIEMHFLPDVFVTCETCHGTRYNKETLEVTYRGKSIADVLAMTIEESCDFFENHPKILRFANCLRDVGLGYLTLGQPSTTLSGGEAQRVKLATELGKGVGADGLPSSSSMGHTLYVLDEPTTGLHFEDIRRLVEVLQRLASQGNTLVVIEHNLDVIKCADWIIDLGPEGGDGGGTIVASGTPEDVAKVKTSFTGQFLRDML